MCKWGAGQGRAWVIRHERSAKQGKGGQNGAGWGNARQGKGGHGRVGQAGEGKGAGRRGRAGRGGAVGEPCLRGW